MKVIRYSDAFKMQVVREVEAASTLPLERGVNTTSRELPR